MMRSLFLFLRRGLFFGLTSGIFLYATSAIAAERIVLKYRFLQNSLAVSDLSTLASTGKASNEVQYYLNLAKQDPQAVRRTLTEPVRINPLLLDRVLNSPIGELALDRISEVIGTRTAVGDRQALRSALVLSATGDGEISLIEVIKNYPSPEIQVDGEGLLDAYRQLEHLRDSAQAIQNIWEIFRSKNR